MSRHLLTLLFLNIFLNIAMAQHVKPNNENINLKNELEVKFFEFSNSIVKWMKNINYNNSDYGENTSIHFNEIKPKSGNVGGEFFFFFFIISTYNDLHVFFIFKKQLFFFLSCQPSPKKSDLVQ